MQDVRGFLRRTLKRDLVVSERDCVGHRELDIATTDGLDLSSLSRSLYDLFRADCKVTHAPGTRGLRVRVSVPKNRPWCSRLWLLQCCVVVILLCLVHYHAALGPVRFCVPEEIPAPADIVPDAVQQQRSGVAAEPVVHTVPVVAPAETGANHGARDGGVKTGIATPAEYAGIGDAFTAAVAALRRRPAFPEPRVPSAP